jgi:hypothetical protein
MNKNSAKKKTAVETQAKKKRVQKEEEKKNNISVEKRVTRSTKKQDASEISESIMKIGKRRRDQVESPLPVIK